MHKTGCFVTSAAMVIDSLGHNVTPGTLNIFLSSRTETDGNFPITSFPHSAILGAGDSGGPLLTFHNHLPIQPGAAPTDPATGREQVIQSLQAMIAAHGPVILRVPFWGSAYGQAAYNSNNPAGHAIVAYAAQGDSVLIQDPGHEYNLPTTTLDDFVNWYNSKAPDQLHDANGSVGGLDYSWLRGHNLLYAQTAGGPAITGAAHSPIEFVITDPLGRRLGYDPTTGIRYDEIPNSSYGREDVAAIEDDSSVVFPDTGYAALPYEIGSPVVGSYAVQVFGLATGTWSLDGGLGSDSLFSLSGTAQLGSSEMDRFDVASIPEPGTFAGAAVGAASLLLRRRPRKQKLE
jgi:hypothetical protein